MSAAIRAEHIWKRYNIHPARNVWNTLRRLWPGGRRAGGDAAGADDREFWALRDVSFEVAQGETLGIIGPNGAGKSTLLKILCGVTEQTRGNITIKGRVAPLIEVGAGFHPELTGRENIYLNAAIMGMSKEEIRRKFDEIVAFSGLERFLDTPVKRYSSGMYVRLGFSVAAHIEPDVLLVDEVLSVGDYQFQRKCVNQIAHLQQQGVTVVFVSHQLVTVGSFCNRAIYLENGGIVAEGETSDVIATYLSRPLSQTTRANTALNASCFQAGEVTFKSLEFLDSEGNRKTSFSSEETMRVRVHYIAHQKLQHPVLNIAVRRSDGLLCSRIRTSWDDVDVETLEGEGWFEAQFKPVQLGSGRYSLGVAILDSAVSLPYGYVAHLGEFTVKGKPAGKTSVVFHPKVSWRIPSCGNGP